MSDSIDPQLLDYYQRELTWLRNAGMQVVDRLPWVKRRLIAHAAGINPGALLF